MHGRSRTIELHEACPDPSVLIRAVQEGGMSPDEHVELQRHLDRCDACDAALIALIERSVPSAHRNPPLADDGKATHIWERGGWKELAPGDRIAHFEIVRLAGRGGMGAVYVATDTNLQRRVALKLVNGTMDTKTRARFLDEARAMARFNHPNIVGIYAVGEHGKRPWVALEYIAGETLAARLRRGPLSLKETLQIGADIARGLAEAHRHGVIHRDLKPGNIMLGEDGRVRVLDFGLAVYLGTEWRARGTLDKITPFASRMMATSVGGTPRYMAPEQWEGGDLRPETDCWALGAILYEMLSGKRPHPAKDLVSLMVRVTSREPPVPLRDLCALPVALEATVMRCLQDAPTQRPSAKEVASLLETIGPADVASAPKPPSPPPATLQLSALQWGSLAVLSGVVTALLLWAVPIGHETPLPLQTGLARPAPVIVKPAPPPVARPKPRTRPVYRPRPRPLPVGDVDDVDARPADTPCKRRELICRPYVLPNPRSVIPVRHVVPAKKLARRIDQTATHVGLTAPLRNGRVTLENERDISLADESSLTLHFAVPGKRYRIDVEIFARRMVAVAKRDHISRDAGPLPVGACRAASAIAAALHAGLPAKHLGSIMLAPPRGEEQVWNITTDEGKYRVSLIGCRSLSVHRDLEDPFSHR